MTHNCDWERSSLYVFSLDSMSSMALWRCNQIVYTMGQLNFQHDMNIRKKYQIPFAGAELAEIAVPGSSKFLFSLSFVFLSGYLIQFSFRNILNSTRKNIQLKCTMETIEWADEIEETKIIFFVGASRVDDILALLVSFFFRLFFDIFSSSRSRSHAICYLNLPSDARWLLLLLLIFGCLPLVVISGVFLLFFSSCFSVWFRIDKCTWNIKTTYYYDFPPLSLPPQFTIRSGTVFFSHFKSTSSCPLSPATWCNDFRLPNSSSSSTSCVFIFSCFHISPGICKKKDSKRE